MDTDLQIRILKNVLNILVTAETPGEIFDLPYEWEAPFNWETFQQDMQEMIQQENIAPQEWKPVG